MIDEAAGTEITIELEGESEGRLSVSDSISRILAGEIKDSAEPLVGSFVLQTSDLHFATVWRLVEGPGNFVLTSSHRLIHLPDPDDGTRIPVGVSVHGNIDFPGDLDYFIFDLSEDETVAIRVSSLLIDTFLSVYPMMSDGRISLETDAEPILFRSESFTIYQAARHGSSYCGGGPRKQPGSRCVRLKRGSGGAELALTYTALSAPARSPGGTSTPTP